MNGLAKLDSVLMFAAVREMHEALVGAKLRKIQQLARDVFLFTLWGPPERRVIVGLTPQAARLHLVDGEYGHADTPSAFCMLLRKHLGGARLELATTLGLERVARLEFAAREEARGDEVARTLVVELLPSSRNLILLDGEDRILGDLQGRRRRGEILIYPQPERPDALTLPGTLLVRALDLADPASPLGRAIPRACFGIGGGYARDIAEAAGLEADAPLGNGPAREALAASWNAFWLRLQEGPLRPARSGDRLRPFADDGEAFRSVGAMLEEAFGSGAEEAGLERERAAMQGLVEKARERAARRLRAQQADLEAAREADKWRHLGDLLTAHLHLVKPRAASVQVTDYERPGEPPVAIELDPDLPAAENAQRYYRRYKKARRAQEAIAEAIARTRVDLEYVEGLGVAVATALSRDELKELAADLQAENPAEVARTPRKAKARGPAARPRRYESQGWEILVGRNPRQNETLSMKLAKDQDLWLHARQIPGAHVIVRRRGGRGDLPNEVLLEAARLAARFSRGAADTHVAVDYTLARYVKKPPGTPAGYVIYSREKTVTVNPSGNL